MRDEAQGAADVEVVTFGCRLNAVESEAIRRAARGGDENLVIVNTCAVTNEALRQARQTIRRLARDKPHAKIAVTGCAAQIEPARFAAMPEVAHVIGNAEKTRAQTWASLDRAPRVSVGDAEALRGARAFAVDSLQGQTRA